MQVRKLEDLVGRPLFLRDSRSVTLTPDGAYLLAHARRMLALNREAVAHFVSPELRGTVRLGASDDVVERFLPPMLRRFAETHPGVVVNVIVADSKSLWSQVRSGALDIVLVTGSLQTADSRNAEELLREQLIWAVCAGGAAACQDPLPVSVWEEGCAWRSAGLEALDRVGRRWRIGRRKRPYFRAACGNPRRSCRCTDPTRSARRRRDRGPLEEHGLPPLPNYSLGMQISDNAKPHIEAAADHLRAAFANLKP